MNYYEEISKMLGVELDEEFKLSFTKNFVYKITLDGLMVRQAGEFKWCESVPSTLTHLFKGDYSVVKLPWKPRYREQYWYYSTAWKSELGIEFNSSIDDLLNWKVGNCFKTKEEALVKGKEIMEAIQKEYEES